MINIHPSEKTQSSIESYSTTQNKKNNQLSKNILWLWLLFIITSMLLVSKLQMTTEEPFVVFDEDGMPQLSELRKKKLDKELEYLESAEQYVLRAAKSGWYQCFSCESTDKIFLFAGEVWRYGYTTKGVSGRYSQKFLQVNRLIYQVQFEGTIEQCMREERVKIYNYALLPENLKRVRFLKRPPGNKKDS